MDTSSNESGLLASASLISAALLATACVIVAVTGVSQQWFEWVHTPDVYAAALVHSATPLRAIIGVDDLFIAAYVTSTVLLASHLSRGKLGPIHVLVMVAGVVAGVLDLEENHHILSMLRLAESGVPIPVGEILRRSDLSQLKWMLAHLAFVLVGISVPVRDASTRAFRYSLVAWQLPIGVLCWTVSNDAIQPVLQWVRYSSLMAGFLMVGWMMRRSDVGDAIGSNALA